MSIWNKLFSAVKGGVNEAAESVADSQAIRILEQEIREANNELRKSDQALVSIVAKHKLSKQKIAGIQASVDEYENYARQAMEKGDQTLALECAQKVAELRSQIEQEEVYANQFAQSQTQLQANIAKSKQQLRQLTQQVDIVKANEAVQKAQSNISSANTGSNAKMQTAAQSLERIKQRQAQKTAEFEAASELAQMENGDALDAKLAQAGITGSNTDAQSELERILGKK